MTLAPRARWVRLDPAASSSFLVTPALSPDGRWVAASGRGGVGLFVVAADGSGELRMVEPSYRGPRAWTPDPVALHFGHDTARAWRPDVAGLTVGRKPWAQPWSEEWGRRIPHASGRVFYHHPRMGTLSVRRPGAEVKTVVVEGAWGVKVGPRGRRVAWCTGTLAEPALHLLDLDTGQRRRLGAGVHPAWFPAGDHLIFARPAAVEQVGGRGNVTGAELALHEVGAGRTRVLTDTPAIAEMQPVVSPDGRAVVFADWRGGGLYRAGVRAATPKGGTP